MADIWDFSSLLDSWSNTQKPAAVQDESYTQISEQMNKEINEISSQLALLESDDPSTLKSLHLLAPPIPQTFAPPVQEDDPIKVQKKSTSKLPPLTKTTRSIISPKVTKPKEAMQMRARKTVKTRLVPKTQATPIFKATPDKLEVVNFVLSTQYVMKFTLQNVSSHTHGFQVRGPTDPAFRFRIVENVNNSLIRPGLHLTFEVTFLPTEPRDYEGSIIIMPGEGEETTAVSIRCYRDPPKLVIPDIVNLGATLVHSAKNGAFTVTNTGGVAFFSFHSAVGREDSLIFTDGPFSLIPSQFQLDHGESKDINVRFKPTETGNHTASFEIRAQHFPQKFSFLAKGFAAVPRLRFAICDDDRLLLPFLPCDANTTRQIEIRNEADVSYPFHIQIVRPRETTRSELALLYPETDTTTVKTGNTPFVISPVSGLIGPKDSMTLNVTFSPSMFAFYRANIVLFANRIPDETGTLGSRKMLTIAAEATTGPPSVSIQPPLLLFNDVVPMKTTKQTIEVVNDSYLNVKLQWRKSEVISPSPVVFDVKPKEKSSVDLLFLLNRKIQSMQPATIDIFKHQPKLALQYQGKQDKRFIVQQSTVEKEAARPPSSQHYAISFSSLSKSELSGDTGASIPEDGEGEEEVIEDEMPNIFGLKRHSSYTDKKTGMSPSISAAQLQLEMPDANVGYVTDEMALQVDSYTQMTFTYSAQITPPAVTVDPPVIDFGCVLAGEKGTQILTLINSYPTPIQYSIAYPKGEEWHIETPEGVVTDRVEIPIDLQFHSHTALSSMITVNTRWLSPDGTVDESLPTYSYDVPVYAVFDRPLMKIEERVIDIGDVFPSLEYRARMKIALLNSFPTDFSFSDFRAEVNVRSIEAITELTTARKSRRTSSACQHLTQPLDGTMNSSARPATGLAGDKRIEDEEEDMDNVIVEFTETAPSSGHLDLNESAEIQITACFCELGKRALPFTCNITGGKYTCAIIANVQPPKINLLTEYVDFSSDFVICKRSESKVRVVNVSGVMSTVRLEMVDDCNGVFSLDDTSAKEVIDTAEIQVSCYSEIHGDYHGKLKLIIEDSWQHKEIIIPMHVKALGSFFGFQKHTLGYVSNVDGDMVSFGNSIPLSDKKVIRRLTLENFSSEAITVDWDIANLVKGRNYADLDIDINDDGSVAVSVQETAEASIQDPFKLLTQRTVIESHGKTVVVVEFMPKEIGTFNGIVTAKSGEFIHTVSLSATVV